MIKICGNNVNISIIYDPYKGYVCPDGMIEEYIHQAIRHAYKIQEEYIITIGSKALGDRLIATLSDREYVLRVISSDWFK